VRLLGMQITASLAPIQSSVADIGIRLRAVEEGGPTWGGQDDDASLGLGGYDKGYDNDIPFDGERGEERVDYHAASAPSRAMADDAEMNEDPPPLLRIRYPPRTQPDPRGDRPCPTCDTGRYGCAGLGRLLFVYVP